MARARQGGQRGFMDVAAKNGIIEIEDNRQTFACAFADDFFKSQTSLRIPPWRGEFDRISFGPAKSFSFQFCFAEPRAECARMAAGLSEYHKKKRLRIACLGERDRKT